MGTWWYKDKFIGFIHPMIVVNAEVVSEKNRQIIQRKLQTKALKTGKIGIRMETAMHIQHLANEIKTGID